MGIGNRTSQAVLLLLLAVTVSVSSHFNVEATATANDQLSRRLPTQRVRGLRKDTLKEKEELVENLNAPAKDNKTNKPNLPKFFRPVPEKFDDLGITPKLSTRPIKSESKLPESNQAFDIKVNQKSGNSPKIGVPSISQKGNDLTVMNKSNKKSEESIGPVENGLEHFHEVEVEIYRREVPSITIQFTVEDSSSSNYPNLADYNELSDVSEEYLDKFFRSVFEDVQVRHDGTVLFVMVSDDDPYTVDFRITLEFIIPGEVPTINFLIDRLQEGLERDTSKAFFISDLSMMSETNPFSRTDTFRVVSRPPVSVAEMDRGIGNKSPVGSIEIVEKSHVLKYVLVGMGCVAIVGAGLMWKKKNIHESDRSNPKQIFSLFDQRKKKDTTPGSTGSGIYGADEATMNYLDSIRKRYRDYDGRRKVSPTTIGGNIAAVEQTRSYDESEDSMSGSVDTSFDDEKKDPDAMEDDLRTIY
mmetsp:Transcript_25828/g.60562  ORF Transcript_25828/g.60562 Transcript_25828/m.60562 type:complete len:471 (-) Transcript_25828:192-1604(-)|eukprot:CAMPEP_0197183224 /NCGR_PEP_ID=MMETSP1423-20130617/7690_1 /TAXON_ID=476441 /ORGANISM="Pseudo-nitzschia heimii, Strain UNC1101" /LENGTH=470 /DNA_ID=CAMNT_0042633787 /DNA_START=102 /DNA_END=1514 /DNA_ORIENTATION=+